MTKQNGPEQFIELNGVMVPASEYNKRKEALGIEDNRVSERHISIKDYLKQAKEELEGVKQPKPSVKEEVVNHAEEVTNEPKEEEPKAKKTAKWNTK